MIFRAAFLLVGFCESAIFCPLPESPEYCTDLENGVSLRDLLAFSLQAVNDGGNVLRTTRENNDLKVCRAKFIYFCSTTAR